MADDTATKKKILIIDDDTFLLDMYSLKFSQSGYAVDTALGSEQAYEKMKQGATPDIFLTDIVMPTMDGFELLEKLRAEKLLANAVVIILSNRGQQVDIDRGVSLGADGYIVKASSTPSEVVAKVAEILSKKK